MAKEDTQVLFQYASLIFLILISISTECIGVSNERASRSIGLDRTGNAFTKHLDESNDISKRRLDRIGSGFIKREDPVDRALPKLEYLLAQTLINKLRTTGELEPENSFLPSQSEAMQKRYIDSIGNGFIKRRLDRIGVGFIKRDDTSDSRDLSTSKRRLDRIGAGFIKRSFDYPDGQNIVLEGLSKLGRPSKRYVDSIGSGFIKRRTNDRSGENSMKYNKRYIDRIGSGFLR